MPAQKTLTVSSQLYERVQSAAAADGLSMEDFLARELFVDLPPHRRELAERLLAWWQGDSSRLGGSVKIAVAKLAGIDWVIPEIEAQIAQHPE